MISHKVATGLMKLFMAKVHAVGFTSLWDTVYYIDRVPNATETLRKHEMVHVNQMREEGKFVFTVKYLWYQMTVGYKKNPYEIEAYKKQEL